MISTLEQFETWVKVQMLYKKMSQRELAQRLKISRPRISEAIYGRPAGKKHIVTIIRALGGNEDNFKEFLKNI